MEEMRQSVQAASGSTDRERTRAASLQISWHLLHSPQDVGKSGVPSGAGRGTFMQRNGISASRNASRSSHRSYISNQSM